nr:hypothetical protein [Kibdelosporangium sp. MJ126-NF4]CEL23086.1 hypothetical protein [Kibdelosporangium sp. MJ126-NF4]CTQ90223.1 hypothetical protein [Kibdelosporangium sp. MJ126-NF4]
MITALPDDLTILGEGRVERAEPARRQRIPSMYADPVAWLVLEAIDQALADCMDTVRQAADDVAVILVSTHATVDTMADVARATETGRLSPLRFAGASPGGAASLACIVHSLRGPSLLLTTEPGTGWPTALTVARCWLRTAAASQVLLSAHTADAQQGHQVRTALLTHEEQR